MFIAHDKMALFKSGFYLRVNCVTTDGHLVTINGCYENQDSTLISELLKTHFYELKSQNHIRSEAVYQGMMCAAFHENKLCRAKIVNQDKLRWNIVVVRLIDLGISKEIKLYNLRDIGRCDPRLIGTAPLANDYLLAHIIHPSGQLTGVEIDKLDTIFKGRKFYAVTVMETLDIPIISLYLNSLNISADLVKQGFGLEVPLEIQMYNITLKHRFALIVSQGLYQNPNQNTINDPTTESAMRPTTEDIPFPTNGSLRNRTLTLNSKYKVHVSYANVGPNLFLVQLVDEEIQFNELVNAINRCKHKLLPQPPKIGSLCLARMSECDFYICRAIVLNISKTECEMYAIDYGHTEMVSNCDIFIMADHFAQYHVFAMRFSLEGVKRFIKGDHLNGVFKKLVDQKAADLKVVPGENPLVQSAELYIEGVSVVELLEEKMECQKFTKRLLTHHSSSRVVGTYIESCSNFSVRLCNRANEFTEMSEAVETHCEDGPPPSRVIVNTACCAKSHDGNWHRAMILSIEDDVVNVYFVDFGYNERVKKANLRCITPELLKWPVQAIKCSLYPHGIYDSHLLDEIFKKTVLGKTLIVSLKDDELTIPIVGMHISNQLNEKGACINDYMMDVMLAPQRLYVMSSASNSNPQDSGSKTFSSTATTGLPHPVPLETPYKETVLKMGSKYKCKIIWVENPNNLYIQIVSMKPKFDEMMTKIPEMYDHVPSIEGIIPLEASVMAQYTDGRLYRATVEAIVQCNYKVHYIDFGNKGKLQRNDLWQLDEQLMQLPMTAIHCSLNVLPFDDGWRKCGKMVECFDCNASEYICQVNEMGRNGKYIVSLYRDGTSLLEMLVREKFCQGIAPYPDMLPDFKREY